MVAYLLFLRIAEEGGAFWASLHLYLTTFPQPFLSLSRAQSLPFTFLLWF